MKYIIGFSGGVDSSYIGRELKKKGHEVLLVNLKNTVGNNKCCEIPTKLFEIATNLGLPIEIVDVTEEFKKEVIENFIETYANGKTPNPCINCNELVRFKILDKVRQKHGYDKISTGHYADVVNINGQNYLSTPKDEKKDQTYMIYRISNIYNETGRILNNTQFILSDITKEEIKEIYKNEIGNVPPKESQNICFIPDDDHPRYIKQNSSLIYNPGKIYDIEGKYLGEHKGIIHYTIGQRSGLNINSNEKLYVTQINYKENTIILGPEESLLKDIVNLEKIFIHKDILDNNNKIFGKVRYHHKMQELEYININENTISVKFKESIRAVTPGQHCVLYSQIGDKTVVIGGGNII